MEIEAYPLSTDRKVTCAMFWWYESDQSCVFLHCKQIQFVCLEVFDHDNETCFYGLHLRSHWLCDKMRYSEDVLLCSINYKWRIDAGVKHHLFSSFTIFLSLFHYDWYVRHLPFPYRCCVELFIHCSSSARSSSTQIAHQENRLVFPILIFLHSVFQYARSSAQNGARHRSYLCIFP